MCTGGGRQTANLDLVAKFDEGDDSRIATEFSGDFYVAEAAIRRSLASGTDRAPVSVSAAEDTVLAKLEWFRIGGESSDRQWRDILGVLRTHGPGLDRTYLESRSWVRGGLGGTLHRARGSEES